MQNCRVILSCHVVILSYHTIMSCRHVITSCHVVMLCCHVVSCLNVLCFQVIMSGIIPCGHVMVSSSGVHRSWGIRGPVKVLLKQTLADLTAAGDGHLQSEFHLFIFKTLNLLWGWLPTGRRLRGRTRPRDPLYYGPPRPPCSYALVMLCNIVISWHHVMMTCHDDQICSHVNMSCRHVKSYGCHVISPCQVTLSCHVMSYRYVMSLCNGILL
jgi:hypothetical protein